MKQLDLQFADPPRQRRRSALRAFHPHLESPAEARAGEARAQGQDAEILAVFRARPGQRLTPWEVLGILAQEQMGGHPLITSVRRSCTTLAQKGLLVHHQRDRRQDPAGAKCSTWSLA